MVEITKEERENAQPALNGRPETVIVEQDKPNYEYFRFTAAHLYAIRNTSLTDPITPEEINEFYAVPNIETAQHVHDTLDTAFNVVKTNEIQCGLYYRQYKHEWEPFNTAQKYATRADAIQTLTDGRINDYLSANGTNARNPAHNVSSEVDSFTDHQGVVQLADDILEVYNTVYDWPAIHELARHHLFRREKRTSEEAIESYAEKVIRHKYDDIPEGHIRRCVARLENTGLLANEFPTRDIDLETHPRDKTQD